MTAIIDYGAGNIRSVEKALLALGESVVVTDDRDTILNAEKIILPGVGAFGDAMTQLKQTGLDEVIREAARRQIPFLGICLGLQLLFETSEEAPGVKGLGILKGTIKRISFSTRAENPAYGMEFSAFSPKGKVVLWAG